MGMRFPSSRAKPSGRPADDRAGRSGPHALPDRACCCPARPVVKVLIPPAHGRSHSADLLLCGHHYRVSQAALAKVGAVVLDETGAVVQPPIGTQAGTMPAGTRATVVSRVRPGDEPM
jgi:hypothetical protein